MEDNTSITIVASVIVGSIAILSGYGCHQVEETWREAIKAGLVQKVVPGSSMPVWAKDDSASAELTASDTAQTPQE